jgi:hypothetical protein
MPPLPPTTKKSNGKKQHSDKKEGRKLGPEKNSFVPSLLHADVFVIPSFYLVAAFDETRWGYHHSTLQCFSFLFRKVAIGSTAEGHGVLNWLKLRCVGSSVWPHW